MYSWLKPSHCHQGVLVGWARSKQRRRPRPPALRVGFTVRHPLGSRPPTKALTALSGKGAPRSAEGTLWGSRGAACSPGSSRASRLRLRCPSAAHTRFRVVWVRDVTPPVRSLRNACHLMHNVSIHGPVFLTAKQIPCEEAGLAPCERSERS